MKGVFYNEANEKTAETTDGEEVEVAGVYSSEPEWREAEITTVPEEHIIEDGSFWMFEEGNVVCITVNGERKNTAFRVKEMRSGDSIEPNKVILTSPDLQETYIFSREKGRYIVELKEPNKPSQVVGIDPTKINAIHPIRDDWLMQEFNATHQLLSKVIQLTSIAILIILEYRVI